MTTRQQAAADLFAAYTRAIAAGETETVYDFCAAICATGQIVVSGPADDIADTLLAAFDSTPRSAIPDHARVSDLPLGWRADLDAAFAAGLLSREPVRHDDGGYVLVVAA